MTNGFVKVLAGILIAASYAPAASAQAVALHAEIEEIKDYAPILWLASGEPFYPSLPHPYAFDGQDNDGDGKIDLLDPDEIWLPACPSDKRCRLTHYAANFRARRPEPRILYRAPEPFLKLRGEPGPSAIQFWFYYVADVGTGSHEGDSEHAFIFINKQGWKPEGKRSEIHAETVRAVVGAGHTEDTANNILATGSLESPTGVMPQRLPKHMPLLVELGKHATAPDSTMDGRFNRGMDCNVFRQACWGSRDGFSLDILEFFGGYREAYSLPRNVSDIILEREALSNRLHQYEDEFPHYFMDTQHFSANLKYRFFPIADLQKVFQILASAASDPGARQKLEKFLEDHRECFWRPADKNDKPPSTIPTSFTLSDEAFAAFRSWLTDDNPHVRVWTKRDFENPEDIFKTYLYPRIEVGYSNMWTQDRPPGPLHGLSISVAEFQVGRLAFMNDSSLEFYANFKQQPAGIYDFGLSYRYFRGGFGGPYFGIGWRGEDRRGTADLADEERDRLFQSFGPAVDDVEPRFERHTGIDLGYAVSVNMGRLSRVLRKVTVGGTIGLRSELFAENLSPVEEAMNPDLPRRTRVQAKLTVRLGVLGPKHPMQR